tara:strand:+ start:14571 stop:15314 length:744 start_codon:yes stop_codon:yes gene_type:complete
MKKAICMDFDGVFIDSTNECIKTALISYKKLFFNHNITNADIKRLKNIRPMVKGANEYLYAIKMVLDKKKYITYSDFDSENFKQIFSYNCINAFVKNFYQVRAEQITKHKDQWIKSHTFFNDSYNLLKDWNNFKNKEVTFYIISLKDKKSIEILIEAKKYHEKVNILDNLNIKSKPDGLNIISKNNLIKKENIIFIDDNPKHLELCIENGFKNSFMPKWNNYCLAISKDFPNIKTIDKKGIDTFLNQ